MDNNGPLNPFVDSLLTDMYQISMAYGYWCNKIHDEFSVFDLFFRKHPFNGEFTIFAGLEEVLRYVSKFSFKQEDINILSARFPDWNPEFWSWLSTIDCSNVKIYAVNEGSIVIPRVPLLRIEGPLAICQLLETTCLVLVNYASLISTNACRHRLSVGPTKRLLEFGLRRAQGPDGAISASRYSYMGGFDGTSNVKASVMLGIPLSGTFAHSFVTSFTSFSELHSTSIMDSTGNKRDFLEIVLKYRAQLGRMHSNHGELAAFVSYAQSFPKNFLALVDTYDTLESGIWNFIIVALALHECGYEAKGIRLDSGDLAYLSKECRKLFIKISEDYNVSFQKLTIVASNDLSEKVLWALKEQGHEIDCFGVGTNLVTCMTQPALGCVYKLVEINNQPRMKISQDSQKVTIPGKKECYRLYNQKGEAVVDLLVSAGSNPPPEKERILCRHPFDEAKRVFVTPSRVEPLHHLVWDGRLTSPFPSLQDLRSRVIQQISTFREDHLRRLNPTPYKLSVTPELYTYMHELWMNESPISEIL